MQSKFQKKHNSESDEERKGADVSSNNASDGSSDKHVAQVKEGYTARIQEDFEFIKDYEDLILKILNELQKLPCKNPPDFD